MKNKKWIIVGISLLLVLISLPFFTVGAEEEEGAKKITLVPATQTFVLTQISPNKAITDHFATAVALNMELNGEEFHIYDQTSYDWFLTIKGGGEEKTLQITPYYIPVSGYKDAYHFDICMGEESERFVPKPGCTYALKLEIYKNGTLRYYSDLTENSRFKCEILPALPGDGKKSYSKIVILPTDTPWVNMDEEGITGTALVVQVYNSSGSPQCMYQGGSPEVKVKIYKTDGTGAPYTTTTKFFSSILTDCRLMIVDENFMPEKGCDYTVEMELTYEIPAISLVHEPTKKVFQSEPASGFYLSEDHELIPKTDPRSNYLTVSAQSEQFEYHGDKIRFGVFMKDYENNPYIAPENAEWTVTIGEKGKPFKQTYDLVPISAENGLYTFELSAEQAALVQPGKIYSVYMGVYDESQEAFRNWKTDLFFESAPEQPLGDQTPTDTPTPTEKKEEPKKEEKSSPLPVIIVIAAVALIAVTATAFFLAKKKKK